MSYSTQKNKLKSFWEYNQKNEVDLENKKSKLNRLFNLNSANKGLITLYDSDWITVTPNYGTFKQATKGMSVPGYVTVSKKIPIEIPEYLLPFINTHIITQTPPTMNSCAILNYNYNYYSSPSIWNITYEGSKVLENTAYPYYYNGIMPNNDKYIIINQSDVDSEVTTALYTKKMPKAYIEYTSGGSQYKIEALLSQITYEYPINQYGQQDFFEYDMHYNYHNLTNITSNGFTAVGRYVYWTGEEEQQVVFPSTQTLSFSSAEELIVEVFAVLSYWKLVGGEWVNPGAVIPYVHSYSTDSSTITFEDSNKLAVYFDSNFDYHGGLSDTYYWVNQISLHDGGSIPSSTETLSIFQTRGNEKSSIPQLSVGTNKECLIKTSIDKYLFLMDATIVVEAKASTEYPSNYNLQSLSISIANTTPTPMVISSNAQSFYVANGEPIKYKILITCKNPLTYEDMVNYNV